VTATFGQAAVVLRPALGDLVSKQFDISRKLAYFLGAARDWIQEEVRRRTAALWPIDTKGLKPDETTEGVQA
jgi:hypothetical protein